MDSAIKKTRKQSSHSLLQNYQQFGCGTPFMSGKGIGYNIDPYGQSFFPNCISAWDGLAKDIAEANTLDIFKSKFQN